MEKQGGRVLTAWADKDLKTWVLKPAEAKKAMFSSI